MLMYGRNQYNIVKPIILQSPFFFFKERSIGLKALEVVGTEVGNGPAKLDQVGAELMEDAGGDN